MTRFFGWFYCLLAMHIASAAALEQPGDFAWTLPIEIDAREGLYQLDLSPAVHQGVMRRDLGDIRVFNGAGEVVPHAFASPAPPARAAAVSIALPLFPIRAERGVRVDSLELKVDTRADGAVVGLFTRAQPQAAALANIGYLLDASAVEAPIGALRLQWKPVADGTHARVRIEASQDLSAWTTVVDSAPLVDLEFGGHRLERNRVELAPRRVKYVRLSWPQGVESLALERVWAETGAALSEPKRLWRQISGDAVSGKAGAYRYDLGGFFPLDRIRFSLPQANTIARVDIAARTRSADAWRPVAHTVIYRITRDSTEVTSPDIAVNAVTERYWLLKVDTRGGGIGAGIPILQAGWIPQRLVFAARGVPPFSLAFGKVDAERTGFSLATLVPGYKEDALDLAVAKLGEPSGAQPLPAPPADKPDYRKWSLWAVLLLAVAVLAAMAYRLLRNLGAPPADTHAQDFRPRSTRDTE